MSKAELIAKIEELNQWEVLMEEAKNEAEALRDAIKAEMLQQDTEEMVIGTYIVRWTSVLSNRFDTTAFKKVMAEFLSICDYFSITPIEFFNVNVSNPQLMSDTLHNLELLEEEDLELINKTIKRLLKK